MTIKIDFEYTTKYGKFRDALYLPDNHSFTDEQITEMKQDRLNNWIFTIENPYEPETVVLDGITYEKFDLDGQIVLKPMEV